jgi:hypothetical protein
MFVIVSAGSSLAAPAPDQGQDKIAVLKKSPEERRNNTRQEKVKDLTTMGATQEEADYYAALDDKIVELEKSKQRIDLENVIPISAQEIASNPKEFKQKILSLDPAALKAGFSSPSLTNGFNDASKLIKDNPGKSKYVIQYPDGSSVSLNFSAGVPGEKKEVTPKVYAEDMWGRASNCNGGGPGTCYQGLAEWTFSSPIGWARAAVFNLDYTIALQNSTWTMTVGNFDAGAASYGSVIYSTPNKNSIPSATYNEATDNYDSKYAQAQGYFNATLTGSVGTSFTFGALSMSINHGLSWTQYVNFRIWAQDRAGVAAYYK